MGNRNDKDKVNYKLLSFFLLLCVIGGAIVVFFNVLYGWLIIAFSVFGILKDWREIWGVIKGYTTSNANAQPTQTQHLEKSGDAYQAARDINIYKDSKK